MDSKYSYLKMLPTGIREPLGKLFNSDSAISNTMAGTLTTTKGANTITFSSSAITGTIRSLTIQQTMTAAASANVVEALRVNLVSNVKTGAWANAIMASLDYQTFGAAHGMAAALCAELIPPNSSLTRGALYSIDCVIGCGASSSWGSAGPIAFMHFENWGTKTHFQDNGYLFHLSGETSGAGRLFYDNKSVPFDAYLKIRVGTVDYFIGLLKQQAAAT